MMQDSQQREVKLVEINIIKDGKGSFPVALQEAESGDEIVYHIGKYASGPHKADALSAALQGQCFIFQRRLGDELFSYVAVKATDKHTKKMKGIVK
jgi:hypothetical protein